MPTVPTFLSSFADKAQSAINSSGIAQHLPSHGRPTSPDSAQQPSANEAASGAGGRSHAFESIQHQLRTFGQQYSSNTLPVQKIITNEKGVAIDLDSLARDSKAQSKELYTWGQTEDEDLKDVTDRLAYINFVQGSLASSLAIKLDAARAPLKSLRDAETALAPKRNVRTSIQTQIARVEHESQKGNDKRISDLKEQLKKAEAEDAPQEREIDLLKRKAVRESEQMKWDAIREYGEKLVLLSQAAAPILSALPLFPPTSENPYKGGQATGAARASLQRALDNYKTGHINLAVPNEGSDLSRSDTRSFGESHAHELSRMNTEGQQGAKSDIPVTPPATQVKPTVSTQSVASSPPVGSSLPAIDPTALNSSPAPIPQASPNSPAVPIASHPSSTAPIPVVAPHPEQPSMEKLPPVTPTIAETGIPVAAGDSGPGPASGSLHNLRGNSNPAGSQDKPSTTGGQTFMSAEEEKRRLAGYSPALGGASQLSSTAPPPHHETAEEEKKRLEREERERVLRQDTSNEDSKKDNDEDLPPYQDI